MAHEGMFAPARLLFVATLCSLLCGKEGGVPVIIDGQEVARIYGSVGAFSAAERVPEIEHRIEALADKGFSGRVETRPIPSENVTAVVAGSILIMAVNEVDSQFAGVPRDELARRYALSIEKAIKSYQVRHSWLSFVMATFKSLLAWLLFFVLAWALWKATLWMGARLQQWSNRDTATQGAIRANPRLFEHGTLALMTVVKAVVGLTLVSAFSFVLSFTFGLFPYTAEISTTLWDYLGATFRTAGLAVVDYLPSGGFVLVVVLFSRFLLKALKFLAEAIEHGDLSVAGMHPEMAKPTYQLTRIMVVLFALIVAFPHLPGGNSDAFKGVSIFVGLLLSLGSSSAVSNVLAGLVLTYMRPFRSGDRVKIADTIGDVLEKSLLVTRLHTIKNVEVVIPNSAILSSQILNYSALARTQGLILNTTVTIGYDTPWRTVHELLKHAALSTDGILTHPPPFVLETSLNDFHVSYELNAYTDRANDFQNIYSGLHEAIQDTFNEAGVEIMSPTFYALRDGNTTTIPESRRPPDYEAPAFRIRDSKPFTMAVPDSGRVGRSD